MKNIIRIISISKPLHPLIGLISFLIIVYSILGLVSPIFSKLIVDEIVKNIQHKNPNINYLAELIFFAFAASIISIILSSISDRLGDYLAGRLRKFLTKNFITKS